MAVVTGWPPWPASSFPATWTAWTPQGGSGPGQLLGPPAPVPQNAGGAALTVQPSWQGDDQAAAWQAAQASQAAPAGGGTAGAGS